MHIEKNIQFNSDDLQYAFSLHYRATMPVRSRLLLIIGITIIFIYSFFLITDENPAANYTLHFLLVYAIIIISIHYWTMLTVGRRMYKKMSDFHKPYIFILSDDMLKVIGTHQQGEQLWSAYPKSVLNNHVALLYVNEILFHLLPSRIFTETEWQILINHISGKITKVKNLSKKAK